MKPKSTLRSFLAIAGSSLLTITYASALEYYFDTNDTAALFGAVAGTWAAPTPGTSTAGWSTDATGITSTIGVDVTTTTSDTVNISTTGNITVSGTVDAGTVKLPVTIGGNLNGGTINFPAVGTIECSKSNGNFGSAITGAGTSLTIFCNDQNLAFYNSANGTNCNNGAAKTIIQQGATPGQGRFGVAEEQNLGPISSTLEFDGGVLRIIPHAVPASQLTSFGARPVNFVTGKNVGFDINNAALYFTCNKVLNQGAGGLVKTAAGTLILNQTNTYTGTTDLQSATVSVSASDNLGDITAPLSFNAGALQITGTSFTSFGARPVNFIATKGTILDIADAANSFTLDKVMNQTSGTFTKRGIGTLVLNQDNTFTGASTLTGGGTVVLDYTTNTGSKLSDSTALTLTNSDLTLKNGSLITEIVSATTLNAGHSHIARDGGTSTINLNNISTRAAGGTITFSAGSIATTDKTNANGILGGWATLGTNWAKNSTNAGDGPITALVAPGDYTAFVTTGGVNTANYNLAGSATLAGNVLSQSVRIENNADDQILDLGANSLTFVAVNGGLLYAGGSNGKYTINGTGQLKNSAANSEMIFNTAAGTLTVNAPLGIGAGVLTKAGTGTLVINTAIAGGVGVTNINQGTLLVNTATTSTGTFTVYNKAKLGGTGTIGGSTVINSGGGLTFGLITAAGSHDNLDLAAGKTLTFPVAASGGSTSLTITSTGGTPAAGTYTLVTAPGGIIGAVPSTVTLPVGWTAGAPYIDGTSLKIQITNVPDTTPPTLTSIVDDVSGGPIAVNTPVIYTVTFSEDIDSATVTAADFSNAGSSAITIGTITETSPGVFTVQVTPTTGGTLNLQIPTTASLTDVATNPLDNDPALLDDTTITVNAGDVTPPTLTSIGDNVSGGPVTVGTPVTYTVTFSEDMDDTTVSSADFSNSGTSTVTIGTITETTPGVFTVPVTPTSAGTLILQIPTSAVMTDVASNPLDNDPALVDDTTITVQTPYEAWAGGALFYDDANGDGVDNGLAFLLGASGPSVAVTLPTVTESGGNLVLSNFLSRNNASRGTARLYVQHSSDLGIGDPWASVEVDDAGTGGPGVTVSVTTPGSPNNTVTATISVSEAAGGKLFGRLNAAPTP